MERFSELSPNLWKKQHFYSKQNVQQNVRHKNVDFQCKSLQEIFVIVLILYPKLTYVLGFQSLSTRAPPQDYITKGKTIKNMNIKKCDKNYCTHSRIRIALNLGNSSHKTFILHEITSFIVSQQE